MNIEVIGDDIYVEGERVARIGPNAPWRGKDDLIRFLRDPDAIDAHNDESTEEEKKSEAAAEEVVEVLTTLLKRSKEQSPIGLLSLGELSYIVSELGEDYGYEADASE